MAGTQMRVIPDQKQEAEWNWEESNTFQRCMCAGGRERVQ